MKRLLHTAILVTASSMPGQAQGQQAPVAPQGQTIAAQTAAPPRTVPSALSPPAKPEIPAPLIPVTEADFKFDIRKLMAILKDKNHEDWVMTAYPDPGTGLPLIGAGFSLGILERPSHPQIDPANSRPFIEPTTDELWAEAGLDKTRLQEIRERFQERMAHLGKKAFREQIRKGLLPPEPGFSEEDADKLLRISILQAVHNAKAYVRNFDDMTAAQQMGLTQLVFQMGTNLEEFTNFLNVVNKAHVRDPLPTDGKTTHLRPEFKTTGDLWRDVGRTLVNSKWYRECNSRAVSVVAMFDPNYDPAHPEKAERRLKHISPVMAREESHSDHAVKGHHTKRHRMRTAQATSQAREL